MKFSNQETSTNLEGSTFKMEANSKAFKVLSDTLYSNKIRAFIREIACNAYDIHKEVGKEETPILIEIPTEENLNFRVRDFGTGLTETEMMEIYTTFFRSTRDNSNNYTGCFGLGTKSPLSYTDHFTVNSYQNGIKSTYLIFRKNWEPKINKLSTSEEEGIHDGLEVIIPIDETDIGRIIKELMLVIDSFKYKPSIIRNQEKITDIAGLDNDYTYKRHITLEHDYFRFYKYDNDSRENNFLHTSFPNRIRLIQGNVAYPIDIEIFKEEIRLLTASINYCPKSALDIYFNTGEISVSPSRENLSMDNETIIFVKSRIKTIIDYIEKVRESEIEEICKKDISVYDKFIESMKTYNFYYTDVTARKKCLEKFREEITNDLLQTDISKGITKYQTIYYNRNLKTEQLFAYEIDIRPDRNILSLFGENNLTWDHLGLNEKINNNYYIDLFKKYNCRDKLISFAIEPNYKPGIVRELKDYIKEELGPDNIYTVDKEYVPELIEKADKLLEEKGLYMVKKIRQVQKTLIHSMYDSIMDIFKYNNFEWKEIILLRPEKRILKYRAIDESLNRPNHRIFIVNQRYSSATEKTLNLPFIAPEKDFPEILTKIRKRTKESVNLSSKKINIENDIKIHPEDVIQYKILDSERASFYRQSNIQKICELQDEYNVYILKTRSGKWEYFCHINKDIYSNSFNNWSCRVTDELFYYDRNPRIKPSKSILIVKVTATIYNRNKHFFDSFKTAEELIQERVEYIEKNIEKLKLENLAIYADAFRQYSDILEIIKPEHIYQVIDKRLGTFLFNMKKIYDYAKNIYSSQLAIVAKNGTLIHKDYFETFDSLDNTIIKNLFWIGTTFGHSGDISKLLRESLGAASTLSVIDSYNIIKSRVSRKKSKEYKKLEEIVNSDDWYVEDKETCYSSKHKFIRLNRQFK
ncbi:MAG: hypothetical protein ACOC3V_01685 [bacterium]